MFLTPIFTQEITDVSNTHELEKTRNIVKNFDIHVFIFEVEIEATECLDTEQSHQIIFQAEGYANDKIMVNIVTVCDCDCENKAKSYDCGNCNDRGKLNCGVCECDPGWSGKCCDCNLENPDQGNQLQKSCKRLERDCEFL